VTRSVLARRPASNAAARRAALFAALLCFAAFLTLGVIVSGAPPESLDRAAGSLAGHALGVADFLSAAGRFPVYFGLCCATLLFGIIRRRSFTRALTAVVALVVAWKVSDFFKDRFHRARPEHWFVHRETSFSYASGHATLALTFYGLWAAYIWNSRLPKAVRLGAVLLLGLWTAAIGWSRLALGAHYATDVVGGYLFGAACMLTALAVGPRRGVRG